jgi:hypothetical protein
MDLLRLAKCVLVRVQSGVYKTDAFCTEYSGFIPVIKYWSCEHEAIDAFAGWLKGDPCMAGFDSISFLCKLISPELCQFSVPWTTM